MNSDVVPPVTGLVEHSHAAKPVDDPIWRGANISEIIRNLLLYTL